MEPTLPSSADLQTGQLVIANIAIEDAPNSGCSQAGIPFACCTGSGTGNCQPAASATIIPPSNSLCTGFQTPDQCCSGLGEGNCEWTQIDTTQTCGADFQSALYYRFIGTLNTACTGDGTPDVCCTGVGTGYCDTGSEPFVFRFTMAGQPATSESCTGIGTPDACCTGVGSGTCPYVTYLGNAGITDFANVGSTPIEASSFMCTTQSMAVQELVAPSITLTKDNSLDELFFGIRFDNSEAAIAGYSHVYIHSISGEGPAIDNFSKPFGTAASTGDQTTTSSTAGDNVGWQVGLSPLP
jgi:hypothetical protein